MEKAIHFFFESPVVLLAKCNAVPICFCDFTISNFVLQSWSTVKVFLFRSSHRHTVVLIKHREHAWKKVAFFPVVSYRIFNSRLWVPVEYLETLEDCDGIFFGQVFPGWSFQRLNTALSFFFWTTQTHLAIFCLQTPASGGVVLAPIPEDEVSTSGTPDSQRQLVSGDVLTESQVLQMLEDEVCNMHKLIEKDEKNLKTSFQIAVMRWLQAEKWHCPILGTVENLQIYKYSIIPIVCTVCRLYRLESRL